MVLVIDWLELAQTGGCETTGMTWCCLHKRCEARIGARWVRVGWCCCGKEKGSKATRKKTGETDQQEKQDSRRDRPAEGKGRQEKQNKEGRTQREKAKQASKPPL